MLRGVGAVQLLSRLTEAYSTLATRVLTHRYLSIQTRNLHYVPNFQFDVISWINDDVGDGVPFKAHVTCNSIVSITALFKLFTAGLELHSTIPQREREREKSDQ